MAFMVMPVYNVDQPVGKSQVNRTDDVRLIQTMLNAVLTVDDGYAALPENGTYTDAVGARIRDFQKWMNSANAAIGRGMKEDGIVHPLPGTSRLNWDPRFPSGRMSTLYGLNYMMRIYDRTAHQQLGQRLAIIEYPRAAG